MLNRVIFMGRLVADPELRTTGVHSLPVTDFTIAVDRKTFGKNTEKKVDFIDCVAWKKQAEWICRNFTKGQIITVEGRLEMREWIDKDGNKRRSAEVQVENAYFCTLKGAVEDDASLPNAGE